MTAIQLTGSLPAQISEDTQLWDWVGQLRLSIDPNLIEFVDISGLGGTSLMSRSTAPPGC